MADYSSTQLITNLKKFLGHTQTSGTPPKVTQKSLEGVGFRRFHLLILLSAFLFVLPVCNQSKNNEVDPEVYKAYELRINGKVNEAKLILEKFLNENPDNAMANFEMARLLKELDIILNMESVLQYCNKAIKNDPDNPFFEFYNADMLFLRAYIAMKKRGTDEQIKQYIGETCKAYHRVLEKDPGCKEAYMYLIDIHGTLPEKRGGMKNKAEEYLHTLEKLDPYYGARAQLILMQDKIEEIDYWKDYMIKNGESNQVLDRLGRAYLMADDPENAENCFNKILAKDSSKCNLYLDLARDYMLRIMKAIRQAKKSNESDILAAKKYLGKYLNSKIDKPDCTIAWTYGMLGRIEEVSGNKEQAIMYVKKAKSINPNFSRAFAYPGVDDPPNKLSYSYGSYFRPF